MGAISKEGLDIANKSREIVRNKIKEVLGDEIKFNEKEMGIIERVVHATADPEYAKLLVFKNNPIEEGIKAIKEGKPIVVDVNMIKAGIRYNNVYCFISHPDVYEIAKKEGITRAVASMRLAKDYIDGGVVVIGNSPTALFEVIRLIKEECIKPKLVVGVPVGFVQASESKEALRKVEIPSISTIGPKGGTPVAVAIINGIIAYAKDKRA
ncbi:cobalt-precorrin-8 methylmutase [Methanocaldococcus fervens]|uniref:Precorrin-8X methylmutase CbiC/CobH n=1 Tax=Methanocaldococcus fervens (strain DSM 4213 / JCM 15782 / AG86) TaxID=573064 RepID=C7P7Q0_METFA|nr:cobalt-precorrin-8 methylmutase [Methanocaldococcus fervens]ACV24582.1 Precorrin-8X methylmutase CbiC/CobH [Methanocaldococcus fervens AG86]